VRAGHSSNRRAVARPPFGYLATANPVYTRTKMRPRKLQSAPNLTRADFAGAARAYTLLAAVRLSLAVRGLEPTRAWAVPRTASNRARAQWQRHIEPTVRAVDLAARVQPGVTCLPRAIALQRMLLAGGVPAEFTLGVRKRGSALEAHAWVSVQGAPVGERPAAPARFEPFPNAPASWSARCVSPAGAAPRSAE
jgi:hypothetical protein